MISCDMGTGSSIVENVMIMLKPMIQKKEI